jgi:phosphopantothenoylcysteine decarboxylase/phosphopantothenate--cysteine ligase
MTGTTMTIRLVRNPDILATLGRHKKRHQRLVGFALESRDMLKYAKDKLRRKNCDLMVANAVPTLGALTNSATLLHRDGRIQKLPKIRKTALAERLLRALAAL